MANITIHFNDGSYVTYAAQIVPGMNADDMLEIVANDSKQRRTFIPRENIKFWVVQSTSETCQ